MSDYTRTTNYSLYKPIPGEDDDVWGDHWNANADTLDGLIRQIDARGSGGGVLLVTDYLPAGQPDGVTDVALYLQEAIDAAAGVTDTNHRELAPGAFTLIIPAAAASYRVGTTLFIPSNSHIVIAQGATLQLIDNASHMYGLSVNGASNVIIEHYGTLDGNRLKQSGTIGSGDSIGLTMGGIGGGGCNDIFITGNKQGLIQNFKNWPVNLTGPCSNVEVRGVRMTDNGNSAEIAGINSVSPLATTGTLSSYDASTGVVTFITAAAHGITVGTMFAYTHSTGPLQGEYVATVVPSPTEVHAQVSPPTPNSIPSFSSGQIGSCARCYNCGFVDCYVARCPDLGMVFYSGNTGGYIRGCEATQIGGGAFAVYSDPTQPASNINCEIADCYVHDTYGGGVLIVSNQVGIFHQNIQAYGNIVGPAFNGGIIINHVNGAAVFGNFVHDCAYMPAAHYTTQIVIQDQTSGVSVWGNTCRNPTAAAVQVTPFLNCTLTGAGYNPTTGATSFLSQFPLGTNVPHNINVGDSFLLAIAMGSPDCVKLEGWHTATAGTNSATSILNFTAPTGLNLTLNRINAYQVKYAVPLSHITPGTYTSDSLGNIALTTYRTTVGDNLPHGYPASTPFVLQSCNGSPAGTGGATDHPLILNAAWKTTSASSGTNGNILNFVIKPNATLVISQGRVLPANYGILLMQPRYCRISDNHIGDYQAVMNMTSCIGGQWAKDGLLNDNHYGPRVAPDPDVSESSAFGLSALNYDTVNAQAVANMTVAGFVTFAGSTQNSVPPPTYFPPQGLTPFWNQSVSRGEIAFLLGQGLGSTGGFNFLQVATIRILSAGPNTYDPVTGNVSITTNVPHTVLPAASTADVGGFFTLEFVTGTDDTTGDDLLKLNGGHFANVDTTSTVLTFTDDPGLSVHTITGGLVVPKTVSGGAGVLNTGVGVAGSLLANDGYGNTRLGGALVHGSMQTGGVMPPTTLTAGGTVTIPPHTSFALIRNSASIATGTVVLPNPGITGTYQGAGSELEINFQNPVGTLTLTGVLEGPVPTSIITAHTSLAFVWGGSSWVRRIMA